MRATTLSLFLLMTAVLANSQQPTGTKIDANTQIRNWQYTPLNGSLPLGQVNLYTYDNAAIFQNLVNTANQTGLCKVYIPQGRWYVSTGIDVPTCVELYGVGFGQGTLFAPNGPILGSVIQAMPSFSGPANYPSQFMLYVDGSPTVNNGVPHDTYNVNIHNITFDCAGLAGCSGFYIGHANEFVSVHDSVMANWSDFGEFHCGAGLGEAAGLPYQNCGDNGSGPYYNNQLVSYGSWVTANSYPLMIMSSLGNKPWSNYTINTTPGPVNAITFQGLGLTLDNIHIENSTNGVLMGPTSGFCANMPGGAACRGLQTARLNQISLGPTGSGYVIVNQNTLSTVITDTRSDSQTTALIQDQRNSVTVPNSYNSQYILQDTTGLCFSVEWCAQFQGAITAPSILIDSTSPTLTIKQSTSPYAYHTLAEGATGYLSIGGSGGTTRDILFADGDAVISARSAASSSYNGANMQSPLLANSGTVASVNSLFCNNGYWDVNNANFKFGNLGGNGFSCLFGDTLGGMGISVNGATQPGTETYTNFITNTGFWEKANGHVLMAPPGSGGAYSASDSGAELTLLGGGNYTGGMTGDTLLLAGTGGPTSLSFAAPAFTQGAVSPSCTTGSTAGSTCTDTITMNSTTFKTTLSYAPMCQLRGPFTGVPTIVGTQYSISGSTMTVTVTIANLTGVAASASHDWCMTAGESRTF